MDCVKINFYKPSSILGKLVCFFQRGKYSHCNITVDDLTYEIRPFNKVKKFQLEPSKIIDSFDIKLSKRQKIQLVDFLDKQIGKSYDYLSIIGFIIYKNDRSKSNIWFCSELIVSALLKVNFEILKRVEPFKVGPVILSYSPLI